LQNSNIARELHDDICQSLAMLSHRIEKVTQGVGRGQIPVSDQLEQIWQQCSALTGDVQAWSHELHTYLGVGFDTTTLKNKEGLGLVGMHERIHLLNGTITIDSKPSAGTRARVPMLIHSNAMTSAAS
jgi:signal transduction histidine kinase